MTLDYYSNTKRFLCWNSVNCQPKPQTNQAIDTTLRTFVQRTTYSVAGTVFIGGSTITAYTNIEEGKGLRRQFQIWSHFAPIMADYYIRTSSHSPYVKLQKYVHHNDGEAGEVRYQKKRKKTLDELYEKHPEFLEILQSMRRLNIKLGQVLKVSALPVRTFSSTMNWDHFDEGKCKKMKMTLMLSSKYNIHMLKDKSQLT